MDAHNKALNEALNEALIQAQWLGLLPYHQGLLAQEKAGASVSARAGSGILLGCEHPAVITLGRRSHTSVAEEVPSQQVPSSGALIPIVAIERGGQATLHSPGQLMLYPIFSLRQLQIGPRLWIDMLSDTTKLFCEELGVPVDRNQTHETGVFTEQGKIAFLGIRIANGISYHGLSINVSNDLGLFSNIRACGTTGRSLDQISNYSKSPDIQELFFSWFVHFQRQLHLKLPHINLDSPRYLIRGYPLTSP